MDDKPVRNPQVMLSQSGNDAILYHPTRREVHVLNPSACFVWELCDGEHSLASMAEVARSKFEQAPSSVEQEIAEVVARFRSLGLVD